MKKLGLSYLMITFSFLLFLSCQKSDSNDNNLEKPNQKPKTEATDQELQSLENLFKTKEIEVANNVLKFKDSQSFTNFNNYINNLNQDQLEEFEVDKGYKSFYRFKYDISKEGDNKFHVRENSHLFSISNKGGLESNMLFNKVSNENGLYYMGDEIIYNSNKVFISEYKNSDIEEFIEYLKQYLKNGIKKENYTFLEYKQNDKSSRTCFLTSQTDFRDYKKDGTKWFRTTLRTFVGANPVRNSSGQILYWSWLHGWGHNITNFRVYLLYTNSSSAPLYIKTDAYITGNSTYQWMWQTCASCSEIDFTKVTSTGSVPNSASVPIQPQINQLIWFIGQVTYAGSEPINQTVDCDTNDGQNFPSICYNCW
jgi:hypothetical protein